MLRVLSLFAFVAFGTVAVADGHRGTADDAIAMVLDIIDQYEAEGREATLAAITDQEAQAYRDRDLFAIVWDRSGTMLAHGRNSPAIGTNRWDTTDADGFHHTRALIETAMSSGGGWVPYKWEDPLTGVVSEKVTYVAALDEDLLVGVGIYAD